MGEPYGLLQVAGSCSQANEKWKEHKDEENVPPPLGLTTYSTCCTLVSYFCGLKARDGRKGMGHHDGREVSIKEGGFDY